jgi:VanZ family protein
VTLARRAGLWLPPLLLMTAIFFFSSQEDLNSGLGVVDLIGRKLIHFGEYALLCFLWWRVLRDPLGSRRAALAALLVTVAYAASDEYHQSFVEGRSGSPIDWAIDSAGAALAAWRLSRAGRRREARA